MSVEVEPEEALLTSFNLDSSFEASCVTYEISVSNLPTFDSTGVFPIYLIEDDACYAF